MCIALSSGVLHDSDVKSADILKASVMAHNREKILTVLGLELGYIVGKSAIIVRALYGLKSAGASFRAFLT